MHNSDLNTVSKNDRGADRRSRWRRLVDSVFGYDFFISYKWSDGRKYAETLAGELESQGFEVFLDSERYGSGDDWQEIGGWTLKRTGQLILVATKLALEPSKTETPVEREVRIFSDTRRRIIPITFAPRKSDGSFDYSASTIECARQNSPVLRYISAKMVVLKEDANLQDTGPSPDTIKEIGKTFNLVRQDKKRLAIFAFISLILVILTIASVLLGARAEASRRMVANQLAERLYSSAALTKNPLEAFLLTAKAAQASTATNDKLPLYLDRVMQLSTRLPDRVINLPITEGVDFAAFNSKLDRVGLVTDNRKFHVFRIPEGDELFVPDYVNQNGIASGTQPSFGDDGVTIRTFLFWESNEPPAPDERGQPVVAANWNVETHKILTPIDNGASRLDDLKMELLAPPSGPTDDPNEDKSYHLAYAPDFDSAAFFKSVPQLVDRSLPARGARANESIVAAAAANGSVMVWQKQQSDQLVSPISLGPQQKSWVAAAFAGKYMATLDDERVLTVWNSEKKEKVWSQAISEEEARQVAEESDTRIQISKARYERIRISPDESVVVAGTAVYRLADGTPAGKLAPFEEFNDGDYSSRGIALTAGGTRLAAWDFWNGNTTVLYFDLSDPANKSHAESPHPKVGRKEFLSFLADAKYYTAGSSGSFQIRDIEGPTIAWFSFGSTSRLSSEVANALIRRVVRIETNPPIRKATLVLQGGGRLEIDSGSKINRDLRLARDGAKVVNPRMKEVAEIKQVTVSPDSHWLATHRKAAVEIWDARSGYPLRGKLPLDGEVLDIQFTSDSKSLLIATTRGTLVTAIVSFPWKGKPAWLEGLAEGLTGLTITEKGDTQVLSLREVVEQRSKLLNGLMNAAPDDKAAACLRARFGKPTR